MENRLKEARLQRNISVSDLSKLLNVDDSTIRNWEAGRREITASKLTLLADTLNFSTDYLLGREKSLFSMTGPIDKRMLLGMHGHPVWTAPLGWCIVNNIEEVLVCNDGSYVSAGEIDDPIYAFPPALAFSLYGIGMPLSRDEVQKRGRIWLEPITPDSVLGNELRGWYHLHDERMVQNEYGMRFYLDTYGVKWLAFDECLKLNR